MAVSIFSTCPICLEGKHFECPDDYGSCRDQLRSKDCPLGRCLTRERALAQVVNDLGIRDHLTRDAVILESSPVMRGFSLWLKRNCAGYTPTGFFPDELPGTMVGDLRNEDLERLTIPSESVDLWIHLDVLEHLFQPFKALKEISRTLKAGALCIFAAPTYAGKARSERAASLNEEGKPEVVGKPEYHGNPQRPNDGSLVTWRYGYDLSLRISRETDFDVEVRRWQSRESAVMGPMTEIYICRKRA